MGSIISPFRGIRYRTGESRDLSSRIAPPYDTISGAVQAELYARDEHNFVRIELPRQEVGSAEGDRYSRAAATLRAWLAEGVLARDEHPSLYLLEQQFQLDGRPWRRRGVLALVRLPEAGECYVLSHEGTLPAAREDRQRLMQACQAMTSPILVMSEDPRSQLLGLLEQPLGRPADVTAEDADGVTHRLWTVRDSPRLEALCLAVGPGPLFIADGHHRFYTAVTNRDEMRRQSPHASPLAGFNYALALIVSARDPGLKILPTHRLISGLGATGVARLKAHMQELFEVNRWPLPEAKGLAGQPWLEGSAPDRHVFGAYCADGCYYVLTARDEMLPPSSSVVESLDVSILHRHLIEPAVAGLGAAVQLTYVTDAEQAAAAVAAGEYDCALFLRATVVSDVLAAARAGEQMPGKSTCFYPKVPAGLVASDASVEPI
jgi:uncharacterized protein (DUF1015 family)